ncbi:MAG: DUF5807 family protein [Haloferacaceae archaeon]
MSKLDEFLAGERLEDVALFLSEAFLDADSRLRKIGEEVDDGVVVVVDGEKGRQAFAAGTSMGAMEFAQTAMDTEGEIDRDLGGGECPTANPADDPENHRTEFVFAFAEAQNEEVGGLYAEGDVLHAYAHCECGTAYSDRWLLGED